MELIISKIASIFLIIFVGFIANKAGVMPMSANKLFVNLLLKVTCPCMILASITSSELRDDTITVTIQTFAGGCIFLLVGAGIGYVLARLIKVDSDQIGPYAFSFGSINNGFIGFPVTAALFGSNILYLMVIHNIALQAMYLYTVGPAIVALGSGERSKFSIRGVFSSLKNINTITAAVSVLMLVLGLHLPSVAFDCMDMIGDATTPLSMLIVGMQLGDSKLSEVVRSKKLFIFSAVKMILLPVLTFMAVNWLPISADVKVCMIIAASFPVAVAVVPVISEEERNSLPAAQMVTLTTLISLAVIPVTASLLMSYYGIGL